MPSSTAIRKLGLALLLLFVAFSTSGNAPAPYWACSGKAEGDRCEPYGSQTGCGVFRGDEDGVCSLLQTCTDSPDTDVNECLWCG